MVGNPGACRNRLSWTGLINHGFLWKHWMGSSLLVFATCCLCLILWFLISCKAMANFSSSLGMLYVKKNHGSFVFLIEFVKEVIAIKISTQPYFPHNLILVSKFVWGKEYVYKTNIVIWWKMVCQKIKGDEKGFIKLLFKLCAHYCIHEKNLWVLQKYYLIRFNNFAMKRGGRVLNNF